MFFMLNQSDTQLHAIQNHLRVPGVKPSELFFFYGMTEAWVQSYFYVPQLRIWR